MESSLVATPSAALFESAPFIFAAAVLAQTPLRQIARLTPFLACGCGAGPAARSIPAALMTFVTFGPAVALGRIAAAALAAYLPGRDEAGAHHARSPLQELGTVLLPSAATLGITLFAQQIASLHLTPPLAFAAGAAGALVLTPCAIGQVALAATLHAAAPSAAAGFLCVAGIVDLRSFNWGHAFRRCRAEKHEVSGHDAFAYLLLALACAIVAAHRGNGVLHPRLMPLLAFACIAATAYAVRFRRERSPRLRTAPALMLAGSILAAPPPAYHATETTLTQAFAGETLSFTGIATQTGSVTTLVRYAITCCRADAMPIVVRLERRIAGASGWMRADGTFVLLRGELELRARRILPVAPPGDAFVYR